VAPSTTNPAARANTPFAAAQAVDPGLVWVGTVDNPTGYSDEMRGFLRTMEAAGYEPALRTFQGLRKAAGMSARERALFERQEARTLSGPTVAIHHYVSVRALRVEGAVNVSRTMFETNSVPESRLGILLERDQVWVPCQFNVETFVRGGVPEDKLRVVGGTMDFDLYDPATTEPLELDVPDDHFVFVTNFAFAERKAWKQLIRAWARAFGPDDGVCLVLKTHSETQSDDFVNQRMNAFFADELGVGRDAMAPIVVKMDMLPTAKLPSLYAAADAYVLASRGEAWGRPFMEAMAMGLPTIASRWSGNLEFMNDGNSFLVDGELVSCDEDSLEVFGEQLHGHSWFEPDVDHLAETMRKVAADPTAARAHAAGARDELITRFGPEPTARRLAELAREAYELHGELRRKPVHSGVPGRRQRRARQRAHRPRPQRAARGRPKRHRPARQRSRHHAVLAAALRPGHRRPDRRDGALGVRGSAEGLGRPGALEGRPRLGQQPLHPRRLRGGRHARGSRRGDPARRRP
jgi:glycosyltransferase involved in cell wall biosynthesis